MRTQFKNTPSRARSLSLPKWSKGYCELISPFDHFGKLRAGKLGERIDTIGGQSLPGFNEHALLN